MLEVITIDKSIEWDKVIEDFPQKDAYYYAGYQKAFMLNGDGSPMLFHYNDGTTRAINVVMKRDIHTSKKFKSMVEANTFFDITTPYGYGGFIVDGDNYAGVNKVYTNYCFKNNIISEFVRFHPVLNNRQGLDTMYDITNLGPTITMDISSREQIWNNILSKHKNVIRKAIREQVTIHNGNTKELYDKFIKMYNKTMDRNKAEDYYYFGQSFYDSIREDFGDNSTLFYAKYNNEIIAMAIILFADTGMHYHLSAYDIAYRNKAATNLLLYEASCWGSKRGYKTFHLGGGVGSKEDNLYTFKKSFNKNSNTVFSIGRKIFDKEKYDYLVSLRKQGGDFDGGSSFFPLYRT